MGKTKLGEKSEEFADFRTANVLGALVGTKIRGVKSSDTGIRNLTKEASDSVDGVVLEVAQGVLRPFVKARVEARRVWNRESPDGWARKLASQLGVSVPVAQQQIDQMDPYELDADALLGAANSFKGKDTRAQQMPGGLPLRFRVVSAGIWSHSEVILGWQASQELVDPVAIMRELDRAQKATSEAVPGFLAMRAHLWLAAPASGIVAHEEGDTVDVDVAGCLAPARPAVYYDVEANSNTTVRIKMPPSGTALEIEDVPALVLEAVDLLLSDNARVNIEDEGWVSVLRLTREQAQQEIANVFEFLKGPHVGFGFLKSCFQKMCRVQANKVSMPDGTVVDGRIVVMVALGLCFSKKGDGFVPDLGAFVRGQTAATKRLAVTCCEDAWPQIGLLKGLTHGSRNPGKILSALLATSLVTVRIPTYFVPRSLIVSCMLVNCMALQTLLVARWRGPVRFGRMAQGPEEDPVMTPCNKQAMHMAARLLRVVRSFGGDMDLFDEIARRTTDDNKVDCFASDDFPVATVPLVHTVDQHAYRGIGHCMIDGPASFTLRFKQIFSDVTGFSPRLALKQLDESELVVRRVRHAERMIAVHIFPQGNLLIDVGSPVEKVISLPLDTGVLAGGTGTLGPFKVKTTAAENAVDGSPQLGDTNWTLLVVIGVEKLGEIVIHSWSAHASDNAKKPKITATARRKVIELAHAKASFKFASPVLPGYSSAHYTNGGWTLKGVSRPDLQWKYDTPMLETVSYVEIPMPTPLPSLADDTAALSLLRQKMPPGSKPALCAGLETQLAVVLDELRTLATNKGYNARTIQLRLLSQIRQQYAEVALSVPGLDGALGADQLKAEEGDWLVYRALLWISRMAPGALRPKQVPKFDVVDARLLRIVEQQINGHLAEQPQAAWQYAFTQACDGLEARFATPEINSIEPFDYQRSIVSTMLRRDAEAVVKTAGHFVSLETGLGKSIVGAWYALKHGKQYGDARRVIWVTPDKVVDTARTEMQRTWGIGSTLVKVVNRANPGFDALINIVGFEWFSSGAKRELLAERIVRAAPTSICVFDEVHLMYSVNIRTSTMRQVALMCAKFVCMTATPIAGPTYPIAIDWLKDTVGFPVNRDNQLVASAMMVAARIELPVEAKEAVVNATFTPAQAAQHLQHLQNGRDWGAAAQIARRAAAQTMLQTAIDYATRDRQTNPGGGVLLIADGEDEASEYLAQLSARSVVASRRTPGSESASGTAVVVTTKNDVTGYNFVRMGAIITGVYATSAAKRHQLRGRIRRIGQTRGEVWYVTVFTQHSILELLHQRHNAVDKANESMEELAELFVRQAQ